MKLRDMMFLVIGGLLVISGMVLNALLSGDAEAQEGVKDGVFKYITCEGLILKDGYKMRGLFALSDSGTAVLQILGDDGKTPVAYLGVDGKSNEMKLSLRSKSKTDKRRAIVGIDQDGGYSYFHNKMGEQVVRIGVGSDGGGVVDKRDKFGYKR